MDGSPVFFFFFRSWIIFIFKRRTKKVSRVPASKGALRVLKICTFPSMTSSADTHPTHLTLPSMMSIAILLWLGEHRGRPLFSMPHDSWEENLSREMLWSGLSVFSFLYTKESFILRFRAYEVGNLFPAQGWGILCFFLLADRDVDGKDFPSLRLGVQFRKASLICHHKVGDICKSLCSLP